VSGSTALAHAEKVNPYTRLGGEQEETLSLRKLTTLLVVLTLAAGACGGDDARTSDSEETAATIAEDDEPGASGNVASATTTQAPATTSPAASQGGGSGGATLTIGDETWSFDSVEFCGMPASPDTSSFVLIAKLGDWQLVAEVVDSTGAQRLEGDGVYDTISFQNNSDPTLSWLANLEAAEVKFMVIDGPSVTASTTFDAVTGLSDDTPGTLEATCP